MSPCLSISRAHQLPPYPPPLISLLCILSDLRRCWRRPLFVGCVGSAACRWEKRVIKLLQRTESQPGQHRPFCLPCSGLSCGWGLGAWMGQTQVQRPMEGLKSNFGYSQVPQIKGRFGQIAAGHIIQHVSPQASENYRVFKSWSWHGCFCWPKIHPERGNLSKKKKDLYNPPGKGGVINPVLQGTEPREDQHDTSLQQKLDQVSFAHKYVL